MFGNLQNCSSASVVVSSSYNLSDTSSTDCNFIGTGDIVSTTPLLSAPTDNGGSTLTMSPTTGSPLIDAGTSSGAPVVDQRGSSRPSGSAYDIGSYEGAASGSAMDITPPNSPTSLVWSTSSPSATTSLTATWTVSNSGDLSKQKIALYTGGVCSTGSRIGFVISLASIATASYTFTGTDATTYSYKILSFDISGNLKTSACSSAILITL